MNSSTSSSSQEWRVVLFVAACLLALEGGIRLIESRLSRDLAQIRHLPELAEEMRQYPGKKILVMGNSLTRAAVDEDMLVKGLTVPGSVDLQVFQFVADATNMANWDYGLGRYFLHVGAVPDELLIGTGPLHLRDSKDDASRLAAYYVDHQDLQRAWKEDLTSWDERCEFILSRISVLHASRYRIKPHVFGQLIPHYFDVEQWINTQRDVEQQRLGKVPVLSETHRHLAHLLQACRRAGVKVRVFGIPLPNSYEMSSAAISTITEGGGIWIPLSNVEGITSESFSDGYHLDSDGATVFTRQLLKVLMKDP